MTDIGGPFSLTYEARIKYNSGGAIFPTVTEKEADGIVEALSKLPTFQSGEVHRVERTRLRVQLKKEG